MATGRWNAAARRQTSKWGEPADKKSFQTILEIVLHIENLVPRLLALARSEQRTLPLQPLSVAVAPLVESVWQLLRDPAALKQLAVRWDMPADARLTTDAELLRGILQNLLANAVEVGI